MVKANAYGHGAVECVRSLEDTASAFAVASIEEALSLRIVGIRSPILLLEGIFEASELELVDKYDLWLAVHTAWQVEALLSYTPLKPFSIWLKVDSGLHRLGFTPTRAVQIWNKLGRAKQVGSLHLMSHFATADAISVQFFNYQTLVMQSLRDYLGASLSLANSAALMSNTDNLGEWNRPGIMLYGSCMFRMNPNTHFGSIRSPISV
ncbi:hypothetical protein CWE25_11835 [Idiomarina fontislapidosi]|uniref:Alanine racemase N-terminal domain-containing protein n=1 Tax=Idiomarina fontislapidosi TaxID=263723 RepID=A0A432XQX5_9GAMM|nr:hypothetical protein CWE25_11835 [Idiomarina fontislapidosi]